LFSEHPSEYLSWFGHQSLPRFNHNNARLRQHLYEGPDSVVARWLGPELLDGWRIDVANITGRYGTTDLNHMVATTLRRTMADAHPESLLLAEHSHDASPDLLGDGWHGIMNYAGFTRPVWQWLKPVTPVPFEPGPFAPIPGLAGTAIVAAMREFAAAAPWRARAHALTPVGSHDRTRIKTLLADPRLVTVAFGLLTSLPGIPMIWSGDEIGQEGANGEDGRRPFPWNNPTAWDNERLAVTRALFRARAESEALRHGGLRWLTVDDDAFSFLRETPQETVLVYASRADHTPIQLPTAIVGNELTGLAGTEDLRSTSATISLPARGPTSRCGDVNAPTGAEALLPRPQPLTD
jgi:alpha-glucosidase